MSEIVKCPLCGGAPRIRYGGVLGKNPVSFMHCGAEFGTHELWNQYAAAMELAKAEVAASNAVCSVPLERLEPAVDAAEAVLFQAKMRVLEVFNE